MNKLFLRIYLPLALSIFFTIAVSALLALSLGPARVRQYADRTIPEFRTRLSALDDYNPDQVMQIADSMGVEAGIVRMGPQGPGQLPQAPRPGHMFLDMPGDDPGFAVEVPLVPGGDRLFGRNAPLIFLAMLLLAEAAVLLFSLAPLRKRLLSLETAAEKLGDGEFEVRVPAEEDGDFLDSLGATFNSMAARISVLVQSHRELLGSVAHEIRTPLARMRFALELLRESGTRPDSRIEGMEKDLDALEMLLSELLTFNRLSRTDSTHAEPVDLASIAADAVAGESWERQDLEICVSGSAVASVDLKLMTRAVANLVRNACRYARSRVDITMGVEDCRAWLEVGDDGPGFDGAILERIGRPFAKGPDSHGSGLGLATVQRVAAMHCGMVSYGRSNLGGASVRIEIPAA